MITNDDELRDAVAIVNDNIQAIQDYLGQGNYEDGKIRFPHGFIRTAYYFRQQLSFIIDDNLERNISYALILSDVFRWLINRTDLTGTAREMIIKNVIILMGSICESMAIDGTRDRIGRRHSFCERATRMAKQGIITDGLRDNLHWLWEKRTGIHMYELNNMEYDTYYLRDYNRAVKVTRELRDSLDSYHRR